ncbi:MAG: T9SS type A sorting domain-containing protein, partial [Cytophagales bacterium]|nr:T9SS type A sorting domain-containing protein [Cytophagales bacterium]
FSNTGAWLGSPIPNPASNMVSFTYYLPNDMSGVLKIYEPVTGNILTTMPLRSSSNAIQINLSLFSPGMYVGTMFADDKQISAQRLVVIK